MQPTNFGYIKPFVISDASGFRHRAIQTRSFKYPVIGQTKDVNGRVWDIREVRSTRHGFDLYFGNPATGAGSIGGRALIYTPELYNFWDTHRTGLDGLRFDLPAGRTTLKRARHRLGFNFHEDLDAHWTSLIPELEALSPREFAAKYGIKRNLASHRRMVMLGLHARPADWWRTPETISLLLSNLTLSQTGRQLNISTSHVHRLRKRARSEYSTDQTSLEPVDEL
jgi:hypothetical protein